MPKGRKNLCLISDFDKIENEKEDVLKARCD
jgi:hypothetical protein